MINSVLIVLKQLNFGGSERYAINLANALVDKNISVILVAGQGPYVPYISPKIKLFFAPISRDGQNKYLAEKIIFDIVKKNKPQLIHAQCRNSLLCCQLARRVFKIPIISHEHLAYKPSEYAFVVNELNSNCDMVITIAPYLAQRLIRSGLEKHRIKVVLNGINLNDFTPITKEERIKTRNSLNLTSYDKVILCLSRIVPGKGIERLVDAFEIVHKRVPNARLIIAGDDEWGGTKAKIEEKVIISNLAGKASIYPAHFNIRKFHSVADVFCHPSINRGMAVMEAMASELPIIAKRSLTKPFVAEHNIHGLLLQTDGVEELADQLTILLRRKVLARQMGKAARKRIEKKFNLDTVLKKILKVYGELVKPTEFYKENLISSHPDLQLTSIE